MAINRLNPDYPDAGIVQLMPSSVAVGSGSSTVNGNGQVSSNFINPIVFASSAAPGQRNIGDWGGIVLLGEAQNNLPANAVSGTPAGIGYVEGLPTSKETAAIIKGSQREIDVSLNAVREEMKALRKSTINPLAK